MGAVIFWLLFVIFDLSLLFAEINEIKVSFNPIVPRVFFVLLIISTFFYYRVKTSKAEAVNFIDLLWKMFITGLITTIGALVIRFFDYVFSEQSSDSNPMMINILYHLFIGLIVIYLIHSFVVWKRLILYQKSRNLLFLWNFFQYVLIVALIADLMNQGIKMELSRYALIFAISFSLILSLNLQWIAYLNFKQKLQSMLLILFAGIYLYQFWHLAELFSDKELLIFDLKASFFIIILGIFCFIYSVFSILVTLFNLPTSSVFERKLKEAMDFQKLSQAIPRGQTEEQTYDILLESSMSAVFADAAWLEIRTSQYPDGIYYLRDINHAQIADIKENLRPGAIKDIIEFKTRKLVVSSKLVGELRKTDFGSIIALPVVVKGEQLGTLVLLRAMSDAFNRDLIDIIVTFVNQASISIENFTLLTDAIENERYKEQLKIAQEVQRSLLPSELISNKKFNISAFSQAAKKWEVIITTY